MSTFDENTEHEDRPEFDDNGEPIIYIDEDIIPDEFASEYDGVIDLDVQDDSFYETVWGGDASSVATLAADDSTTGEEVTDPLEVEVEQDASDTKENDGILEQANEDYNNAVDILIDVLTQALAQGEITEEMNASILDAQGTKTKNEQIIKEICNVQEDNSILKQLADIKANMVAANVDDIIDILTEGGTKPWLYKDSDNNVLVDSQSIPELTVLVNKLNLIATGGDEASEIQLTPEFIKLVSSNINITAENITLEGLVTANENFKILEDGSMMAKNGYFTGQIFVGDGSVIGDAALSDTIRNGANNGTLAIQKLNVVDADIKNLKADKADISELHATNAEIDNLKANKADIEYLDANYATIQQLNAANANISNLQANKANITDLNATNANISNLNATVGNIQTLVNGNLTSDNIQSMVITGDKFTVANGFIKNAMIDSISANKINTGTINTNNVSIQSEDGSMIINGTTQQFKDNNGKVRIQIGKDATGNFTFALFSQDGVGVLIDENGIKSGAVPDGLIVNDMVADNANISGGKLDISSVISSINNNENTLNSSKIKFDDTNQTLDIAFNQLKSKVETIENITIDGDLSSVMEQVTTNTTNISVMQGQISSLISNTTITKQDGTVVQLKDEYNSTKDTVNSHTTKIGALETNYDKVTGDIASVTSKQSVLEQNLDGFKATVSATYQTKDDMSNYPTTKAMNSAIDQKAGSITQSVSSTYATKTDLNTANGNISSLTSRMQTAESKLTKDSLTTTIGDYYTTSSDVDGQITSKGYATTSQLQQTATDLTATFNNGYNQGVTQMNAEGIKVYHNQIDGENYTHIAPSGFWIKYKGENIFVCDQNGLTYKGTITGSTITGGTIKGTEVIGGSLNVEGTLTANRIVCEDINSPKYPGVVTEDLWLYVSTGGNDDSELESGATFETFDGLLDKLPKNLNGHEVLIEMSTNITENVEFKGFHGGRIKVLMKGHTLYGYVNSEMGSARIAFYSGYIGDNTNEDNGWGEIHPNKGYPVGNYTTTVSCVDSGSIALYNIDVYGADNYLPGSSDKVGMAAFMWGSIYSNGTSCYGCDIMGRANVGGRIHDVVSWNTAAKYGWYATSGGYITLASGSHTGGATNNYRETNGGKVIVVDGTTFVGNTVQKPTTTAPTTSTTKTVTYKSNYGDTYRSSVYNSWKKDNTARQGDYGYGDCSGLWFFGNQFSGLKGKTINKVTIKITRQSGGSYSAVGLAVRTHNYSSRPSGAPTLGTSCGTLSLATGSTDTLTITNSGVLNGISNGTVKGFGIRTTYDSAHYAVCSGSVTVKITYTE